MSNYIITTSGQPLLPALKQVAQEQEHERLVEEKEEVSEREGWTVSICSGRTCP